MSFAAAVFVAATLSGCDPRLWVICGLGVCEPGTDYSPPETPQDVSATAFDRGVEITWRRSADSRILFQVLRTTVSGRNYVLVGQTTGAIWRDTGGTFATLQSGNPMQPELQNGTKYYYIVKAVEESPGNVVDESLPSLQVDATPRADIAPRAPSPVTATAGATYVDVVWEHSFTGTRYNIYRSSSATGIFTKIGTRSIAESLRFRDDGLSPGTYFYAVSAENRDGAEGQQSQVVSATPGQSVGFSWLATWGTVGTGPGQFGAPVDVATDAQGRIDVLDLPSARIEQFDRSRTFLREFGETGVVCSGRLVDPVGLAADAAGNTYVTDREGDCVQKFGPDGSFKLGFGTTGAGAGQFQNPGDVATDVAGNIYVVDTGNNRVQKFNPAGVFQMTWGQTGGEPGRFVAPSGIAVAPSGDVYVAEEQRIQRFDGAGGFISEFGSFGSDDGEFSTPQTLAVNAAGDVYVADWHNHRVQRFTAAGAFIDKFGSRGAGNGEFDEPVGIAVDCAGKVYVSERYNHRIQKFGDPSTADPPCGPASPTGRVVATAAPGLGFEARFSSSAGEPGAIAQRNGKLSEKQALQRGSFRIKLLGGARTSTLGRRLALSFARGTWQALFDVAGDPLQRRGSATGTLLTTSKNKRGGQLCLAFHLKLKATGKLDVRGTFRTLGGTRAAASLNARGSYRQTASSGRGWMIRGTTTAKQGKRRSLPARCRAVKKAFARRAP